jgi:hypothetical protein
MRVTVVSEQVAGQPGGAWGVLAVDYFSLSVRMGLKAAVALESTALLRSTHVDGCLPPRRAATALRRVVGPRTMNRTITAEEPSHFSEWAPEAEASSPS